MGLQADMRRRGARSAVRVSQCRVKSPLFHTIAVEATPLQTYLMPLKSAPQARKVLGRERIIHDFSTLTSDARRGPARAKSAAPATAVLRGGSGGGVVLLRLLLGLLLRLLLGLLLRRVLRRGRRR